jgi:hypothetical protein
MDQHGKMLVNALYAFKAQNTDEVNQFCLVLIKT